MRKPTSHSPQNSLSGSTKPLLRLLRLASRGVLLEPADPGETALLRPQDGVLLSRVPDALLHKALANGLVRRKGNALAATGEAESFLKRAMAEREDEIFAGQHGERASETLVEPDGSRSTVRRNLDDQPFSTVARLRDRTGKPYLPPEAVAAGERLAADFERGHLQPRITASFEPRLAQKHKGARPSGLDLTDSALAARLRVGEALTALGPELSGVALDICCFAKGLEAVERERQWPARSAKLMLRTALLALARHYTPPPARTASGLRHWGESDYRPPISRP
ncbi:DUF6456 domain-containing protein [Agrobacterium vitis]|uniref:DUF6456 domain-containing protein n=1 Tax=Agrobacterium vitis TaxID=373 RepID=UPI0015717354|nr:DUF6456 domain-containing protein [Agrobacterium vitis]NSZ16070.1 hypothetical protein [Agrobacterium vitis]UJL86991.1 hypothetical protein AVF2S5_03060 [Agrobacterium vitis]